MTRRFLSLFTFLFTFTAFAQNVEFKAANFKDDKDGLKNALDAIKAGDEFFELGNTAIFEVRSPGLNYGLALKEYEKAQKFNPKNAELNFKIGVCHINSTYCEKGISFIYEAYKLDPACNPFMEFYNAKALQLDRKYAEAIKAFEAFEAVYKKADNFNKFVSKGKKECRLAQAAEQNPIRAWVDNVSELNSQYNDLAPSITTDGGEIIFTSDRPNGHTANAIGEYDKDIYSSSLSDGKWSSPNGLKGGVNTEVDDVSNNLSYDGTHMLLHREIDGQFDIMESTLQGLNWTAPAEMNFQISSKKANEKYAAYSHDGWSIYFSRDNAERENGFEVMNSAMRSKIAKDYGAAQMISTVNSKFHEDRKSVV